MHVPSWQTVLQVVNLGPGLLLSYDSIFSPHFESSQAGLIQADERERGGLLVGGFSGPLLEVADVISSNVPLERTQS